MKKMFELFILCGLCLLPLSCRNKASQKISRPDDSISMKIDSSLFLFVGTYTQTDTPAQAKATGIYIYRMNRFTVALSLHSVSPHTINPSYLAIHPNKLFVYAVNETGGDGPKDFGAVSAFRLDRDKMQLQFINSVSSKGKFPCYISVDASGKFVMVANYGSGNVALYPLQNDGSLGEAVSIIQHQGKGPHKNQDGPHAHMIVPDPEGKYIYTSDLGIDRVQVYRIDTLKRQLEYKNREAVMKAGAGPRHIAFHPSQPWMYVVAELNGTIEAFTRDKETGALSRFQSVSTLPAGVNQEASCADIHISPSGKFLYASNRAEVNSIAIYSINERTGELSLLGHQDTGGKTPRGFVIDPSGSFLLVANQNSSNVVTFKIDPVTGMLHATGIVTQVPTPVCLKFY